jgi:SAM-dependent methyltransferase
MQQGNTENRIISYRLASRNGFGDGWNAYPHSMAWFNGELFVGVTRANLCMIKMHKAHTLNPWPIKCPKDVWEIKDRQVEVWALNPEKGEWRKAFRSPLVLGREGNMVTRDIGYRAMSVFEKNGEKTLCIATWAPKKAKDPGILMTRDGREFSFAPIMENGKVNTFRSLEAFKGKLYIAPTGRFSDFGWDGKPCISDFPVVMETDDPASGKWTEVSEYGFGDPENLSIYELGVFNGHLYAGTFNPTTGCQIWKSDCEGSPPYKWKKVVTHGAYRGNLNEMAMTMCAHKDALYVGTGIQNGGFDYDHIIGPAAAEILRIHPDDSWEVVVGEQRQTPEGFKLPVSGYEAGFNRIYNGYIWEMESYNGWIYAGTLNWCSMLPFLDLQKLPYAKKMNLRRIGIDSMMENFAGCHLWRSRDGSSWEPVTQHGFGNPYNQGIRSLTASPHGLFIGVSNPFGPEIATRNLDGWDYVPNPLGGLEIWQGYVRENERRKAASTSFGGMRRSDWPLYHWISADYFGYSGFRSTGLWDASTRSQRDACFNLARKLISITPAAGESVLNLDSNEGGMAKLLTESFPEAKVTGATFSYWKIERCRTSIDKAEFIGVNQDGTLPVETDSYDCCFAIEPCFYYNDRRAFMAEMRRIIRPGGYVAVFDMADTNEGSGAMKASDGITGLSGFLAAFDEAGFSVEERLECTADTWERYCEYRLKYLEVMEESGHLSFTRMMQFKDDIERGMASGRSAFMAVLRKR